MTASTPTRPLILAHRDSSANPPREEREPIAARGRRSNPSKTAPPPKSLVSANPHEIVQATPGWLLSSS